tara:strand:- start:241 stop:357 length:117 start_codon:yes stop_codon:yes gene_type:complete
MKKRRKETALSKFWSFLMAIAMTLGFFWLIKTLWVALW